MVWYMQCMYRATLHNDAQAVPFYSVVPRNFACRKTPTNRYWTLSSQLGASSIFSITTTSLHRTLTNMRRTTHRKPSKLALTLSFFFLGTLVANGADASQADRRSWRPDTELAGAPFVLGDGKTEGSKVKGYEGEWPLWSSFRKSSSTHTAAADASNSSGTAAAAAAITSSTSDSSNATAHVCSPIGECEPCPEDVIHLPYCRPYNNRRRVACSPVTDRTDAQAVQSALDVVVHTAKSTSSGSGSGSVTVRMGYEACGKSAKQEAKDYFEMIAVIASIAIFSVWAFVQRQKLLFKRQNLQLQSRVMGSSRKRSSGMPPTASGNGAMQAGNRKKRAARLVGGSLSR